MDLSRIDAPDRSKFNPMSQKFVGDVAEIHEATLNPEAGGSTYHPHTASVMPVYYPPDRSPGNPDLWVVGGAPNPATGTRFPTVSALSSEQFTPALIESNIYRTANAAQHDKSLSAGTWYVTGEKGKPHEREGQIDLDVSDLWKDKDEALRTATERGEEAIFGNQGAVEEYTVHSPKYKG